MDLSGRPLTDNPLDFPLFVDREDALRKLVGSIDRRSNVLVAGPPGSGKTSFLHRAVRELRQRGYAPTFVDAAPAASVEDFVDLLSWRLGRPGQAVAADVVARQLAGQEGPGRAARLQSLIANLGSGIEQHERKVLLIDEPPSGELGHTLFGRLRDELWQLPFIWVVAVDSADRAAITRPPADAFFPVTAELGPLSDQDARALLAGRLGPNVPTDIGQLVELAGGSPRRLIALARDVVINERTVSEIVAEEQKRRQLLDELGDSASRLFDFLLASGPASASDDDLLAEMDWTRARATQVLNSLEEAGLVTGGRQKGGRRKLFELADLSLGAE